jgi:hypothetical protein
LFRRSKPAEPEAVVAEPVKQGKGRPTPSRKEAEAAARARAKAAQGGTSRKSQRSVRAERSREIRQRIKDGDERYLPARDRGPVRRFVRDYVDHRLCLAEFAIPLLFASLLFSSAGQAVIGSSVLNAGLLMVLLDSLLLRFRLRKEMKQRFPDQSYKGTTLYALMRALQIRFLRLPKPQVRLGQSLPQRY